MLPSNIELSMHNYETNYLLWKGNVHRTALMQTLPSAESYAERKNVYLSKNRVLEIIGKYFTQKVYKFSNNRDVYVYDPDVYLNIDINKTQSPEVSDVDIIAFGDLDRVQSLINEIFDPNVIAPDNEAVTWAYYMGNGIRYNTVHMKPVKKFYPELYPYIDDVDALLDKFYQSSAPILILSGDPGTGKTSFIRYMIEKFKWKALTTFDEEVMKRDEFYMEFILQKYSVAVLEDADILLTDRVGTGNHIMSRLLNISDGLMDLQNRKMIFTANLKSISQIDEAFLRAGRCFGCINFRLLSSSEVQAATKAMGLPTPVGKDMSIGDIINDGLKTKIAQFGFK